MLLRYLEFSSLTLTKHNKLSLALADDKPSKIVTLLEPKKDVEKLTQYKRLFST